MNRSPKTGAWVRDLLSGAQRAEIEESDVAVAPRTAQPAREASPLGSLSVDIARAVDHEAALDIWRRYRGGERGAFSRRLYTLKGQQTFEDIRRRYQGDAAFRSAVDRYCEDFERLLDDIARTDRDGRMTESYVTSETGKVYTMLAHAASDGCGRRFLAAILDAARCLERACRIPAARRGCAHQPGDAVPRLC